MQSINDLGSYQINQADRWEPLKSPDTQIPQQLEAPPPSNTCPHLSL